MARRAAEMKAGEVAEVVAVRGLAVDLEGTAPKEAVRGTVAETAMAAAVWATAGVARVVPTTAQKKDPEGREAERMEVDSEAARAAAETTVEGVAMRVVAVETMEAATEAAAVQVGKAPSAIVFDIHRRGPSRWLLACTS